MYSTVALLSTGLVTGAFRAGPPPSGYQQTRFKLKPKQNPKRIRDNEITKKSADGFGF